MDARQLCIIAAIVCAFASGVSWTAYLVLRHSPLNRAWPYAVGSAALIALAIINVIDYWL